MYHLQYETTGDGYILDQTVDTDTEKNNHNYTRGVTYRVPRYYTILPGVNVPSKSATTDASVRAKYNDLVNRITEKAGEIIDASGLYISRNGQINGIVIGKDHPVRVETISAEGDIQRFHYRTLVHIVKNDR